MTTMRSASASASSWPWVTKRVVIFSRCCRSRTSSRRRSRRCWSRLAKGSSRSRIFGSSTRRAGQRHPLLLAAGELVGHALAVAGEADLLEHGLDPAADLVPGQAAELQAEGEVLEDVHVGPERVALEDHAGRALLGREAGHVLAVDGDRCRWSGSRSRRSSAAASTCPSRRGRAGRRARRRRR